MKTNGNKGNLNCYFKHVCTFIILSLFLLVPGFTLAQDFTVTTIGTYGDITVMEGAENYDAENPDSSPNPRSWYESPYQTTLSISGKSILLVPSAPVLSYPTISGFPLNMRTDRTPIAGSAEPASIVQLFKKGLLVGEATALEKDFIQSFTVGYEPDEPSLSPDGKTLAYTYYDFAINEYSIALMDLDTMSIIHTIERAEMPQWSPDGSKLAHEFPDNLNYRIGVYDMGTGKSTPLTDDLNVREYLPSWSSDSNKIAFVSTRSGLDDIWIKDLVSGSMTQVTNALLDVDDLDLSPDATKLAYLKWGTLSIIDLLSEEKSEIDSNAYEGTLDWSPDSKRLAFVSFSSGPDEVFVHDTEMESVSQITDSGEDKLWPHWSPDGRQIVYGARGAVSDEVWLLPLNGQGEARMLRRGDPDDSLNYLTWMGWGGIGYIIDRTLEVTYLAGHFAFDTVFLDAGQNTFHATATDDSGNTGPPSDEITIIFDASVILTGTITVTPPEVNLGDAVRADYTVSNSGNAAAMGLVVRTIVLDPEDHVVMASSEEVIDLNVGETHTGQSTFSTDNLSLKSYNVLLQAIHLDETENIASASFIVRDGSPPTVSLISPTPGSTINEAFDLAVRATDNASGVYKVEYQIDGGDEWKDLPPSDSATGKYSITLDPTEVDEGPHTILFQATDNASNVSSPVSTSITIAPRVDMTTTLDAKQYGMNEDLRVHVRLTNVGWKKAVALDVAIKDTGGETIASFDPITTTLDPNETQTQDYDFTWNTGTTYAGAYHIYAVLTRAGDTLNENTVDFTILPVMVIDSRVTTDNDKTHYSMNEDVFAMMEVTNNGNAIASVLDVKLTISQEGGSNLFSEDLTITDLTPGAQVGLGSTWNTGQNPSGEYLARMEVYHAGNLVSEGQADFVIDPLVIITGTLEVTPTEVALGEAVGTNYAVRNSGNTAADGLVVKVLVRNQGTQAVVAGQEQALAIGINETGTGTFTFTTGGYDLGSHEVLLQYLWEGVTHNLAQGLFTVIDAAPPQVTIISPEGGKTYDGPFELTVTATDDASGVEKVEYQIDGGEWKVLLLSDPATNKYSTTWEPTEADEGLHAILFQAMDNAGNVSSPVSISITIAPRVDMTTTLNPEQYEYGMNEDLRVYVYLANVGWGKAVTLDVAIKDTGGETIASFDPIATNLDLNETQDYDFTWNTGTTNAGAYHVYAVLTRAGDILNENTVDFTILPVMVIDSSVATDKTHYSLNEDVFAVMEVTNNGNDIASVLDVKLTISQVGGSDLFSKDLTITDLTPGAQVGLGSTWNTGKHTAGDYLARMEVYHAGDSVSEGQAAFVIDPLVTITGALEVTPTEVALGEAVGTNYAVRNNGNTTANGLIIKVLVRNQGTQAVVAEQEQVLSLNINETGTGTFTFTTGGYDLGPYEVLLQYLWEGVTHDLAQGLFTVIDANPPQVTIISPEGDKTYDEPFELTVTATDDASGVEKVEYQIDGGEWKALPLSDPATGKYSTTWEPTVEDDGTHTIRFRATDKAGNTSTPVSVSITIEVEFISPFERLTGTISAVPNPVSYGWEVSFIYSIKNDTTEAIEGLTVRVLIVDPNPGEIKMTLERTIIVPPNGTATGNLNASTLELGPGVYAAKLQVASGKAPEPRILESTGFEVVPSLEVTESMADPVNLLVWVNDGCYHRSHHQGIGEDEDDFDDYGHDIDGDNLDDGQRDDSGFEGNDNLGEVEGKEHIGLKCAPSKKCIRKDLIEAILAGTVDDYLIVYKGRDFEQELRNPYHTDILILGDHKPLTDHFVEELREKVYSGTGIISSLWLEKGWGKYYYYRYAPIFGVMYKGGISGRYHTITTVPSQITEENTIEAEGKALQVKALEDTTIAGWIKRKKGWKHGYDTQYYPHPRRHPAIVLNQYGLGKAIYFAIDLGLTLTDDNEDQISELIENAISHVHRTPEAENFLPNQLIPYEVTVKALGAGFDVRITETFPAELDLYNPATGEWITESPWTFTMHLEPNGVGTIRYYVLTPDAAGTYTIETEVGFVHEEDYIFFQKSSTEIVVEMDSSALVVNIIAELDSLSASKWDRHKVRMAIKYMEKVGQWEIVEVGDIDWNIHNILKAINWLRQVKSTDIAEIRLMLDDLLRVEEGMYYYFVPVP